ncbi:MAG TPA: flagellar biosynthesis protein FlhB [Burkholderiales bacterium]|nr:flagellar biosynthesis protein FlhB [Burkholderiales bacterium]
MAQDSDLERTEQPSERRLAKAREEGQVARSRELASFALLVTAGAAIWISGDSMMSQLAGAVRSGLTLDAAAAFDPAAMITRLSEQTTGMLIAVAPLLGLLTLVAAGAPMLLSGWMFSWDSLQPDFGRLNPLRGLGNLFSMNSLIELAKAIAKVVLIGAVAVWVIRHNADAAFQLMREPIGVALGHGGRMVAHSFLVVAGSLLIVAAIDVPFQLWNYKHKLRMSRDELRDEAKELEGDPQVKAAVRSAQREMARKRMMAQIPKADVVVTNPTHYAVALKYEAESMRAPRVVAKGAQLLAGRIREIAAEHRVPILEAPPLARALYHHTEIGDQIPEKLFTAVAQVLAYVFQLRQYREHGGMAPPELRTVEVPAELDPAAGAA